MRTTLSKLRERRAQGDRGFTLIELLVVVVILGVLIAIAIPLYLNYRRGANDASAKSDLRNAINVLEQCNADNSAYPGSIALNAAMVQTTNGCAGTINASSGTVMGYFAVGAAPIASYVLVSENSNGATKYYCYNSTKGGSVAALTAAQVATAGLATTASAVTGVSATSC